MNHHKVETCSQMNYYFRVFFFLEEMDAVCSGPKKKRIIQTVTSNKSKSQETPMHISTRQRKTTFCTHYKVLAAEEEIQVLDWPACSPDLSPIENVWLILKRKMQQRRPHTDMEEFVQSSGDDGIVVFTLGSMIDKVPKEMSNRIASALAQIPQKVLWRYGGEKPDTLGENTRIYKWIPQNDLLGHPKTRAFITHGGTNGVYEAIYHGVPMVGIPLFGDQPDNMVHMTTRAAAVVVDSIKSMQPQELVDKLNTVINDPSYKENAMRLSRIHHDRPMKPLDESVFWIEFVMRNKGAKHLRVEAHNLTWYQYHCLDVFAFLTTVLTLVLYICFKMAKFFIMRCCFRSKRKSKKE